MAIGQRPVGALPSHCCLCSRKSDAPWCAPGPEWPEPVHHRQGLAERQLPLDLRSVSGPGTWTLRGHVITKVEELVAALLEA